MGVALATVSADPIDTAALTALVSRPETGAVSLFVGIVRNHDRQATGEVVALHYTAHPTAEAEIARIVEGVLADLDPDDDCTVASVHRIGELLVGDAAFVVAVSAPHRTLAFAVCEQVVERVKTDLPIWKQQFEADGSYRWSGL